MVVIFVLALLMIVIFVIVIIITVIASAGIFFEFAGRAVTEVQIKFLHDSLGIRSWLDLDHDRKVIPFRESAVGD